MVPVRSYTTCNGIPVGNLIKGDRLDAIEKRLRGAGGEVVALLKNGSAFYSPAASAIQMAESYLFDQRRVLAAAAMLNGEYGLKGIYLGVPVIIGKNGLEKIVEIELTAAERQALAESAERVKQLLAIL
jgi:malate dehydrogenase